MAAAHRELTAELLKLTGEGSPLAGLTADEPGALDGGLAALDDPGRWESYASLLEAAGRDEVSVEAVAPPSAEMGSWSVNSFGALFCEVRVSAVTMEVRVSRFLGSFDCGRVLNPKTAASESAAASHAPMGARGTGEIGITGVGRRSPTRSTTPPARASATLPGTPDKLR